MNVVSPPDFDLISYIERAITYIYVHIPDIIRWLLSAMSYLYVIAIPVSILLIIGIVVSVERLKRVRKKEEQIYDTPQEVPAYEEVSKPDPVLAVRWKKVLEHVESQNPNDWRQAIVEADIILDEILTKQGYQGESVGEKLKRVERADFETIDLAWDAHKVRNRIAHDGSSFEISQHEARRVINNYRQVFSEFYYI